MAAAKRRRRLPTLVNRGLGLIEVILPRGSSEDTVSPLPDGRRDDSGFWFPLGYDRPGDIFTPQQRRLQAKQRAIQRGRRRRTIPSVPPAGDPGQARMTPDRTAGAGKPASGGIKTAARDPDGSTPAATRAVSGAGVAAPVMAAILGGGFGAREMAIPLPPAHPESDIGVAACRPRDAAAAAPGRRVDSLIPSE